MVARQASEAELDGWMTQLARGERAAFDPLFRALHPRALRLARARLATGGDDVAQSALLKVFSRACEFRPGSPVLPWFYAIVANEITAARRKQARPSLPLEAAPSHGAPDPERNLLERELARALEQAIEALDPGSAEALAAMLGQSAPLDVAGPTFRKRVSRAYGRLRLLMRGSYGE
jgi:RNA polymerase sigma factor (sigma-70 family)